MDNLKLIYDYKHIDKYRLSFNELANSTFGIDFEKWYQKSLWNDRYICFSYADGDRVVSNVSVSTIDFIVNGRRKNVVQIGTVMTHPDYRGRGLAARLMSYVLKEYENKCEMFYLFPNLDVLDFYLKFGFKPLLESRFTKEININNASRYMLRKLDMSITDDLNIVIKLASERAIISEVFGTDKSEQIVTWYALYVFPDSIYYLEDKDIVVMFDIEGDQLKLYDVLSRNKVEIDEIIERIATIDTKRVIFDFNPELKDIGLQHGIEELDDIMYVKGNISDIPENFKHPITSHA